MNTTLQGALAVALLALACQPTASPESEAKSRPRPVKFATIGEASAGVAEAFSATIQSRDASQIAFRVSGTVVEVKVNRGDRVKKGQRLAELDQADLKTQLAQAQR